MAQDVAASRRQSDGDDGIVFNLEDVSGKFAVIIDSDVVTYLSSRDQLATTLSQILETHGEVFKEIACSKRRFEMVDIVRISLDDLTIAGKTLRGMCVV